MEEMESPAEADGDPCVAHVDSVRIHCNRYDVAVFDPLFHSRQVGLRDTMERPPGTGSLHDPHPPENGRGPERRVVLPMVRQFMELLPEGNAAEVARDLPDDAFAAVVPEPVGEVVEAGGVAVPASAPIADPLQGCGVVLKGGLPRPDHARQDDGVFDERDAVEGAQVDDEPLGAFLLQCPGLIARAEEVAPDLDDQIADRSCGISALPRLLQQRLADFTVFRQKNDVLSLTGRV